MLAAGIIIIIIGGGLFWLSKKQQKTSAAMQKSKAVPINQLQPNTQAEVQGTVVAKNPLTTPFSNHECVYYKYEVEKEVRRRDAEGRLETDWEQVEEDDKMIPFMIEDQTGQVMVNPEGATIEARDLGEQRFRRGERFDNDILRNILSSISNTNTRATEEALLANEQAYIFGYVTEGPNGLEFKKSGKDFLISHKSEEQVQKSTAHTATIMKVLGIIGLIVGAVLAVMSFTG